MQYIIILAMSVMYLHADMQTTKQTQDFDTFLTSYINTTKNFQNLVK